MCSSQTSIYSWESDLKKGFCFLGRERGTEKQRDRETKRQRNNETELTLKIPSKAGQPNWYHILVVLPGFARACRPAQLPT